MKSAMSKLHSELCGFWISSSGQHPLNLTIGLSCIGVTSVGSALLSSTGVGQLQIWLTEVFELLFVTLRTPIPVEKREYHSFLCLVTLVMEVSMLLSGFKSMWRI